MHTTECQIAQARLLHACAVGQDPEGGHGQHQPGPVDAGRVRRRVRCHGQPMRFRVRKPCPDAHPVGTELHGLGGSSAGTTQRLSWPGTRSTIKAQDRLRSRKAFPAVTVYWPSRATKRQAGPRVAWKVMVRS